MPGWHAGLRSRNARGIGFVSDVADEVLMQGAVRGFVDLYYLLRTLVREIVVDSILTVLDTSKDFWSH